MEKHIQEIHVQGYSLIDLDDELVQNVFQFYDCAGRFFNQPMAYKDQFRTPSLQGYLTPYPGLHELFEFKKSNVDPQFQVPPQFEPCVWVVYDNLFEICKQILKVISIQLTGGETFLDWLDNSTFRVLHYDQVKKAPCEVVEQFIPPHNDSSLLTIAPKSTAAALEIECNGEWINIEKMMNDNQAVIFAGECMARLTNNYYPALYHRPAISLMRQRAKTRISTPFFLRGRSDVILDSNKLDTGIVGKLDDVIATPVTIGDITDNVNNCRENMPWK